MQCSAVQCSTVQYSAVQCSAVQCSAVQHSTAQYSTVQYSTVQYSAAQRSTAQYLTLSKQITIYQQRRTLVWKMMATEYPVAAQLMPAFPPSSTHGADIIERAYAEGRVKS